MTAAASGAGASGPKLDPIAVLVDAVEVTITTVAAALAPLAESDIDDPAANTVAPAFEDVVADALRLHGARPPRRRTAVPGTD